MYYVLCKKKKKKLLIPEVENSRTFAHCAPRCVKSYLETRPSVLKW